MHEEEFQEDRDQGPSRSAQRRDALAVLEMARQLVELPEAVLARIGMDEDLRELVRTSRKITAQIARKRQIQYLAKHLRRLDEEALAVIRSALQHDRAEHLREARALHAVEHWRDRLLEEGDAALSELLEHYPQA
ncbi:MAG TPA: ribosome biogenesis factor YjgA, partial [Arenimonas sp.]|nr:ribosome biogenesis factor YjgA [Arenimonas sp.]